MHGLLALAPPPGVWLSVILAAALAAAAAARVAAVWTQRRAALVPVGGRRWPTGGARHRVGQAASAAAALVGAAAAALLLRGLENSVLLLTGALVGGLLSAAPRLGRARWRRVRLRRALAPFLDQLATAAFVHRHPLAAIAAALPAAPPPLSDLLQSAVAAARAGTPPAAALRAAAACAGGDFYLHQLACLVEISLQEGAALGPAVQNLLQRYRLLEELQAEERTELFGYHAFTALLAGLALLPLFWWAATGDAALGYFIAEPLPKAILTWSVLSSLAVAALPWLLTLPAD